MDADLAREMKVPVKIFSQTLLKNGQYGGWKHLSITEEEGTVIWKAMWGSRLKDLSSFEALNETRFAQFHSVIIRKSEVWCSVAFFREIFTSG